MNKRILITGGAGFVGHHFIDEVISNTDWDIVALVRLNTVGDIQRIADSMKAREGADRIKIVWHDLRSPINPTVDARIGHIDYVCHLAANSHVDRSITHPVEFFEDNVMGTVNLLEWARRRQSTNPVEKFLNFNTDEVFGPAPDGYDFKETDRMRPSNPYSGAKMGQWAAGYCYWITYKLPVISTHMMNIFGERQNSEKLVPKTIKKLLAGEPMTIHCKVEEDGSVSEIGLRHWLHARNAANATLFILQKGEAGEVYNIVGDTELNNLELVEMIAEVMGKKEQLEIDYVDFHKTRPGHDRRYALCGEKLKNMGWVPPVDFKTSLQRTVQWYTDNPEWLQ